MSEQLNLHDLKRLKKEENDCPEEIEENYQENPFLNPLIVSIILDNLHSIQDLNKIRQVCKLWNTLAFNKWQPLATLGVRPSDTLCSRKVSKNNSWALDDFWREFQNVDNNALTEKPYSRYTFRAVNLFAEENTMLHIYDDDTSRPTFWNQLGPFITYIKFDRCIFPGNEPEIFEKIVIEILPSLTTLVLSGNKTVPMRTQDVNTSGVAIQLLQMLSQPNMKSNSSLETIRISGETPMCFYTLVAKSPNLQTLEIDDNLARKSDYRLELFRYIFHRRVACGGKNLPLKNLDVMNSNFLNPSKDITTFLNVMDLPLEYLCFTVDPEKDEFEHATKLCQRFMGTLKILKVYRPPYGPAPHISPFYDCHPMPAMIELYLYGNVITELSSLKYLPNLKLLHIDPHSYANFSKMGKLYYQSRLGASSGLGIPFQPDNGQDLINPSALKKENVRLEKMEEIHLNTETFLIFSLSELTSRMQSLSGMMPNLKRLQTNLDRKGFRTVCKFLPMLEEIVLLFDSRIGDEDITGLNLQGTRAHAVDITGFKNLRKFHIEVRCDTPSDESVNRLGDQSVFQGFLKMATLQSVLICASRKMTEEGEQILKRHVPHVQVIRNYEESNSHGDGECCSIKLAQTELLDSGMADN